MKTQSPTAKPTAAKLTRGTSGLAPRSAVARVFQLPLLVVVACALLLGACASNDESVAAGAGDDGTETAAPASDETNASAATETGTDAETETETATEGKSGDADDDGPATVADLLGFGPNGPTEEDQREMQREGQRLTATCMIAEGFEYTPREPHSFSTFDSSVDRSSREYAEQFGFGVSTEMGNMRTVAMPDQERVDPNREYVKSLSESEQAAYEAALFGPDHARELELDENGQPDMSAINIFEPAGCMGEGQKPLMEQSQRMMTLMPSLQAMEETISADSRVIALDAEWSSCMADAGYDYPNKQAAFLDVMNRMFATSGVNGSRESGGVTIIGGPSHLDSDEQAVADAELDAVADFERALAVANFDCSEDTNDAYSEIRAEYEQRFLDNNRDLIGTAPGT